MDDLTYLTGCALQGILAQGWAARSSPSFMGELSVLSANVAVAVLRQVHFKRLELKDLGSSGTLGLDTQIEDLARHIQATCPGEPSRSEGSVATAIRLLDQYREERDRAEKILDERLESGAAGLSDRITAARVLVAANRRQWGEDAETVEKLLSGES
jgi:hypothetical protein